MKRRREPPLEHVQVRDGLEDEVPERRRRRPGRRVVRACVDALRQKHPGYLATLGSQVHAVGFYESLGFRCIEGEEPFMDGPGCLHRTMVMET